MRGIVIAPPFRVEGSSFTLESSDIDPIKLRQYLLYWDMIDFPDNNIVSIGESPEVSYLQSAGKLKRTQIRFNSWDGANLGYAFAIMQTAAFDINSQSNQDSWSIAQTNKQLLLPKELNKPKQTVEIELYESIPVPSAEVSLGDILEFKEKRQDELLEFRHLMDEFYLSILNSADIPRAKTKAIEEIQRSIVVLNRIMSESKFKRFLSTVKVELNLSDALRDMFLGSVGAKVAFGLSPEIGAAIGLATAAIKVGFEIAPNMENVPANLKDYAYLFYAGRELI